MLTFKEFCKAKGMIDDWEDIAFCVADYLHEMYKDIEIHEPYATRAATQYRDAERIVAFDLYTYKPHEDNPN